MLHKSVPSEILECACLARSSCAVSGVSDGRVRAESGQRVATVAIDAMIQGLVA